MTDYNTKMMPILAPTGLPEHLKDRDIKDLQRELGLVTDGQCGPKTIRAIAAREYARGAGVIVGPKVIPVDVPLITYLDEGWEHLGDTKTSARAERLTIGVIHYDVTNSSAQTHKVLLRRELSTHFMIDGDGTLYQCHDPITSVCHHAGTRTNKRALGIDLNSPALRQYERSDRPRPEVETRIHGQRLKMLDYWPEQIDALKELMRAMMLGAGLPIACPRDKGGAPILTTVSRWLDHHGWIGHYHITARKIDPAPLDWDEVCP